jgi:hypothetical protein
VACLLFRKSSTRLVSELLTSYRMSISRTKQLYRIAPGILVGFAAWVTVAGFGFLLLRTTWSSYAAAEPTKSYTLSMLISRLMVGVVCTLAAGAVAALVAKGSRTTSLFLGIVLLLISAPVHLPIEFGLHVSIWADYPAWYHFTFLLPLAPLTVLGGMLATVNFKKNTR